MELGGGGDDSVREVWDLVPPDFHHFPDDGRVERHFPENGLGVRDGGEKAVQRTRRDSPFLQ